MKVLGTGDRAGRRDPTGRRAAARSIGQRNGIGAIIRSGVSFAWPIAWRGAVLGGLAGAAIAFSTEGYGYRATADVLVRPNAVDATFFQNDTQALLDTELAVVQSADIIDAAAKNVPGIDSARLAKALTVRPDSRHSTLRISVRGDEPELARTLTNAVASTYLASVQNRSDVVRRSAVSVLHNATDVIGIGRPNVPLYSLVGLLVGATGCFAIAMMWRIADPRLLDPDALELTTGRPLVGKIPAAQLEPGRLVMIAKPDCAAAESYRSLVSKLPFFALEEGVRCVAVTGSAAGDEPGLNHSDVASNLAIACANSGIRTMLVSGDLRHEAFLARQLRPESPGLTDLILARAPWRESEGWRNPATGQLATGDVVYMTSISNLAFVPTGRTAPNPGDVMSSRAAGVALSHLKHLCDLVILDTPDYANPETANIVRYAEAVIAVVSRRSSRKAALHTLASSTRLQAVPLYFVLKETGGHRRRRRATHAARGSVSTAAVGSGSAMTTSAAVAQTPSPMRLAPERLAPERLAPEPAPTRFTPEWTAAPVQLPPEPPRPTWMPPVPEAPAPPPPPPTVSEPPAAPERPTSPSPFVTSEPTVANAVAAPPAKAPKRKRGSAWTQARVAARLEARSSRQKVRYEAERKKPPPRGKQY